MQKFSLEAIAREQLAKALTVPAGRAAATVYGGSECALRQTVVALKEGTELAEHDNPGEATVQVLGGRVRLNSPETTWELRQGDLLIVPNARHSVTAITDATIVLTVVKARS
ncbi:MAG: cupin domain-containing protein [Nakamurella sp.]